MPCYRPLRAFKDDDGGVTFSDTPKNRAELRPLSLPCGQCVGCRLRRSRDWAVRGMHEASLHENNCFITLTFDDAHLPQDGSLHYPTFQKFAKRLRKRLGPFRHFTCGEYGELYDRPHFHSILFGLDFPDKRPLRMLDSKCKVFDSKILQELWPFGWSSIGSVTFESVAYVARYCVKKVTGKAQEDHYRRFDITGREYQLEPEFAHMSLKPGIGAGWFQKFSSDVYTSDYVIVDGRKVQTPRYYDKQYEKYFGTEIDFIKFERMVDAEVHAHDNTDARLAVKEIVAEAGINLFKRDLT